MTMRSDRSRGFLLANVHTMALAAVVACAAGSVAGCAASKAPGEAVTSSRSMSEVKRRELAAAEAAKAKAAEGTAEVPAGDEALAEWMKRAESDGLIQPRTGTGGERAGANRGAGTAKSRLHPSDRVAGEPGLGIAGIDPVANEPASTEDRPAPVPTPGAGAVVPIVAGTLGTGALANAAPDGEARPVQNSIATGSANMSASLPPDAPAAGTSPAGPLAALLKLTAARSAGDATISDAQLSELARTLTPREKEFYDAWLKLNSKVAADAAATGDVAALKRAAAEFAQEARGWSPLRLPVSMLCTRVEGFGMYTELPNVGGVYKFMAGRKAKFIVYSEVEGFAARKALRDGRDGFETSLTQELTLYSSGRDRDVVAWRKSEQVIRDFSRNPRRDFFVIQIVELPENLGVGGYTLKVRLTDPGAAAESGSAAATPEAEAVIQIDIVADASAMR